jgi:hypothetical protein
VKCSQQNENNWYYTNEDKEEDITHEDQSFLVQMVAQAAMEMMKLRPLRR